MTGITNRIIAYMAICEKQKRLAFNTLRAYNTDMRQFIGFLKEKGIESAGASEITKEILKEYICNDVFRKAHGHIPYSSTIGSWLN